MNQMTMFDLDDKLAAVAAEVGLDAIAAVMHQTAIDKGFWNYDEVTSEVVGMKLALVHSEVTEVLEAIRKNKGEEKVVEEMADVIIRLLDLYAALRDAGQVDSSLDDVLQLKMNTNTQRPTLHGNKF